MSVAAIPRAVSRPARSARWAARALWVGLVASSAAAGELEIEWRAPAEPVRGFVIERRPESGAEHELIARLGPEAREFVDDAVPAGGVVCYRVRAILRDGSWAPSEEQCAPAPAEASTVEAIDVAAPVPVVADPPEPAPDAQRPDGPEPAPDAQRPDPPEPAPDAQRPDGPEPAPDAQRPDGPEPAPDAQRPDPPEPAPDAQRPDGPEPAPDAQRPDPPEPAPDAQRPDPPEPAPDAQRPDGPEPAPDAQRPDGPEPAPDAQRPDGPEPEPDLLPDVDAPGPDLLRPSSTPEPPVPDPSEPASARPRISDRFRPVPAERFLGVAPEPEPEPPASPAE